MNVKNIQLLAVKSRNQLIDEYKNLKPEPYATGIKTAILFAVMAIVDSYFTGPITDKMTIVFVVTGGFIALEILFVLARIEKKINLLFELEKIKETEENENSA